MGDWLQHLNQALYDFNRFVFYCIREYAKLVLLFVIFMACGLVGAFWLEHEVLLYLWVALVTFGGMWAIITLILRFETIVPEQTEDQNDGLQNDNCSEPLRRSWRQALTTGLWWALYGFMLLTVPLFLATVLFG